jgi:hypothetical protein
VNKQTRQAVYNKFGGHCAYCGNEIEIKDMQVDHVIPKRIGGMDDINNLNPACRRCNHYKRASSIERFRTLLLTLHERIKGNYICKVAEDYGIIAVKEWDGKFYFEKIGGEEG